MAKLRMDVFLELLRQSGLVSIERLDSILAELKHGPDVHVLADAESLARRLVRSGLLSREDAGKLLHQCRQGVFLGKYRLLKRLDKDSTSSVYLAEHLLMQRRAAIKVLSKSLTSHSAYLERFHHQARAAAALEHRNIVRTYDVDNAGDIHYLVMEYVEGQDLQRLVEAAGPLDYITAADYLRQAAEGLACAHHHGLFHCDLKPSNLLVTPKKVVKLLGFGLARSEDKELTVTGQPPEAAPPTSASAQPAESHIIERNLDIFGLGCTFYFMLAGVPAFGTGTLSQRFLARQAHPPADVRALRPDVPQALLEVCHRMLGVRPEVEFPSAEEVGATLRRWLKAQGFTFSPDESGRLLIPEPTLPQDKRKLPPELPTQSRPPPLPPTVPPLPNRPRLAENAVSSSIELLSGEEELQELSAADQAENAAEAGFVFELESEPLEKADALLSPIKEGALLGRRNAPRWLWWVIGLGALVAAALAIIAWWKNIGSL